MLARSTVIFSNYLILSEKDFKTFWFQCIFALDGEIRLYMNLKGHH